MKYEYGNSNYIETRPSLFVEKTDECLIEIRAFQDGKHVGPIMVPVFVIDSLGAALAEFYGDARTQSAEIRKEKIAEMELKIERLRSIGHRERPNLANGAGGE